MQIFMVVMLRLAQSYILQRCGESIKRVGYYESEAVKIHRLMSFSAVKGIELLVLKPNEIRAVAESSQ